MTPLLTPIHGFAWIGHSYLPVVAHGIDGPLFVVVAENDYGYIAGTTDVVDNEEGAAMEVEAHRPEASPNVTRRALGLALLN